MLYEYETIIILRAELDDAALREAVDRLEAVILENDGHLLDRDDWGKRKLAYPIEKQLKGHYIRLNYLAPAELVSELERRIRILDAVVRFMTVRLAEVVEVGARVQQAAEHRRVREEEARRRAEQEAAESEGESGDESEDEGNDSAESASAK